MTATQPAELPACACGRTAKKSRLPAGWKRHRDIVWCDACWRARYVLRAITMTVASPPEGMTWQALRAELRELWAETTRCANWMMTELYARDVKRGAADEKMPPMTRVYLYPEARIAFPALPPQTVASLEQSVQKKYRAKRYQVVWTHAASLPTHRYPTPYPVHNQAWSASVEGERPVVSVRLKERRELRLKSGHQFRRQMEAFRRIAAGDAAAGELAIYPQGVALRIKLVAWLERRPAAQDQKDTLTVRTGKDHLLAAINAKDEAIWTYHGDHLPRWAAEHRRQLERWADDSKFEQRPVPAFAERRAAAAVKYHNRMASAAHEIAAQLAGYARRRRFARVLYNDSEKAMCPEFPWARLRDLLFEKLDAFGIELEIVASAAAAEESPGPLAEE